MKDAIRRSGYLMEQRLVPLIESFGYKATPNQRFQDSETGEVREVDVFAISAVAVSIRRTEFVFPILLIACKNLQCPLVFFTQKEIRMDYFLGDFQISGMPQDIATKRGQSKRIDDFLNLEKFHHYYRTGHIASQFCAVYEGKHQAGGNRSQHAPFEAGHLVGGRIDLLKDFYTLARAVEAQKRDHAKGFDFRATDDAINLQCYYPIFLTSGPLVECFVGERSPRYRRVHRVGFLLRYVSASETKECRIDVVDQQGVRPLLETIQKESDKVAKQIGRQRRLASESVIAFGRKLRKRNSTFRLSYVCGEQEL